MFFKHLHEKKLIVAECAPFKTIQFLFKTFFNILNNKRDIILSLYIKKCNIPGVLILLFEISRLSLKILKNVWDKSWIVLKGT